MVTNKKGDYTLGLPTSATWVIDFGEILMFRTQSHDIGLTSWTTKKMFLSAKSFIM